MPLPWKEPPIAQELRPTRPAVKGFVALLISLTAAISPTAFGHPELAAYIQHTAELTVGPKNIDLTLDLMFFEVWSSRERMAMDSDVDGRITRSEIDAYVAGIEKDVLNHVKLKIAGFGVPLILLYKPEVDLLGNNQVGMSHHLLRLQFFASTPPSLRPGDELVVEDGLWPGVGMLPQMTANGTQGCRLEVEQWGNLELSAVGQNTVQRFRAHCIAPPKDTAGLKPGTAEQSPP